MVGVGSEIVRTMGAAGPGGVTYTSRTRTVAAGHLAFAGALNLAIGTLLAYATWSGLLVEYVLGVAIRYLNAMVYLDQGPLLTTLATDVALVVGLLVIAIAIAQFVAGALAYEGQRFGTVIGAALAGAITVVTIPWCAIAVLLLWLTKDQFEN